METKGTVLCYVDDIGDFVKCVDCDALMLLPRGADRCPHCGETDLMWVNEENPETTASDLKDLGYTISHQPELGYDDYLTKEAQLEWLFGA